MDADTIRNSPIGAVVPISGFDQRSGENYKHWAYLPDTLTDTTTHPPAIWSLVPKP